MDHFLGRNDEQMQCRGILHIVESGDTLYKIGKKYGVPLSRVMYANPYVNVYNLQVGDEICVPIMMPRIPQEEGFASGRAGWAAPMQEGRTGGQMPPMQEGRMGGPMPPMQEGRMGGPMPPMQEERMERQMQPIQEGRMGGPMPPMQEERMERQMQPIQESCIGEQMPMMDRNHMDGMQGAAESGRGTKMGQLEGGRGTQMAPPESGMEMRGAHYLGGVCTPAEDAGGCAKMPGAMPWENQAVSEGMVEEYLSGAPGQS